MREAKPRLALPWQIHFSFRLILISLRCSGLIAFFIQICNARLGLCRASDFTRVFLLIVRKNIEIKTTVNDEIIF